MSTRRLIATLATVAASGAQLAPGRACADEHEWLLALQPAVALDKRDDRIASGGGGSVDLAYGVVDALWLRATAHSTVHALPASATAPGGTVISWFAGLGLGYSIDIIRFVPSLEFAIGLVGSRGPGDPSPTVQNEVGIQLGLAFDYLLTRRVSLGAVVRYTAALSAPAQIPLYLFAGPRIAFHFGG